MVNPQILVEPGSSDAPISFHRFRGNTDYLCGFFNTEATEKAKLDDTSLPRVELCQPVNGTVDRK
jgi:hypothetical protein